MSKQERKITKRPAVMYGPTIKEQLGCGNAYGTINDDELCRPMEVFVQVGKSGQCARVHSNAMCRIISHSLRAGVDPQKLMRDCLGETCDKWDGSPLHPRSCAEFIGWLIGFTIGYFTLDKKAGRLIPRGVERMRAEIEQAKQMLKLINDTEDVVLTDAEPEFIENVAGLLGKNHPLSDKQIDWLQDIYYRVKEANKS